MKLHTGAYTKKAHKILEDAVKLTVLELRRARFGAPSTKTGDKISKPFSDVYSPVAKSSMADWYEAKRSGVKSKQAAWSATAISRGWSDSFSKLNLVALTTDIDVDERNDLVLELDSALDGSGENLLASLGKAVQELATKGIPRGYTQDECYLMSDYLCFGEATAIERYGEAKVKSLVGRPLNILAAAVVSSLTKEIKRISKEWIDASAALESEREKAIAVIMEEFDAKAVKLNGEYMSRVEDLKKKCREKREESHGKSVTGNTDGTNRIDNIRKGDY